MVGNTFQNGASPHSFCPLLTPATWSMRQNDASTVEMINYGYGSRIEYTARAICGLSPGSTMSAWVRGGGAIGRNGIFGMADV